MEISRLLLRLRVSKVSLSLLECFDCFLMTVTVGPVFGNNVVLPPKSVTALPLTGTILKTDSPANLKALGDLFSSFLAGNASILQVTGNEVVSPAQPGSPVKWLSAAFKTLTLDVSLPGHVYDIVSAATLKDLDVSVLDQSQSEAALVTNNATEITFKNPFGFSLSLVQAGGIFILCVEFAPNI